MSRSLLRALGLAVAALLLGPPAVAQPAPAGAGIDIRCDPARAPGAAEAERDMLSLSSKHRFGDFLRAVARRDGAVAERCGKADPAAILARAGIVRLLWEIGEHQAADELASSLLPIVRDSPQHRTAAEFVLVTRLELAAAGSDPGALGARLAEYETWLARNGRTPAEPSSLRHFRRCRDSNFVRLRCEWRESVLYGQYFGERGEDGRLVLEAQFAQSEAIPPAAYAPGTLLAPAAEMFRAFEQARQLERDIAPKAACWMDALDKADKAAAASCSEPLLEKLDALAAAVDLFDPRAVSRAQPRILATFVKLSNMRLNLYGRPRDAQFDSEAKAGVRLIAAEANGYRGLLQQAIAELERDGRGFLRTDDPALFAFIAMFQSASPPIERAESVWRLLALSFGPQAARDTPTLVSMMERLAPNEQLIALFTGVSSTGVGLFARRGMVPQLIELDPGGKVLENLAGQLTDAMAPTPRPSDRTSFPLGAAQILYFRFICPGAEQRAVGPPVTRLTFFVDAFAERLPFPLLARPKDGCRHQARIEDVAAEVPIEQLKDVSWLAQEADLRLIPFGAPAARSNPGARGYTGVAVADAGRLDAGLPSPLRASLPRLNQADAEIEEAGSHFAAASRTLVHTEDADEGPVRRAIESHGGRVIHLAAHAIDTALETGGLTEPVIVLRPTQRGSPTDGYLRPGEIRAMRLSGAAMLLSMCRSASPGRGLGNGIVSGLGGSFLTAGASSAVVTYWSISDAAAAAIAPTIARSLASGSDISGAVRSAQRQYRASRAQGSRQAIDPYYWAGYITVEPFPAAKAP